jgi:hypothetical protein
MKVDKENDEPEQTTKAILKEMRIMAEKLKSSSRLNELYDNIENQPGLTSFCVLHSSYFLRKNDFI